MGLLTRLERRSASQWVSESDGWISLLGGTSSRSGVDVTESRALGVSAIWAAVQLLSRTMSTLPLRLYRRREPGPGQDPLVEDDRYWMLKRDVNPEITSQQFRAMIQSHLLLHGNGYALIEKRGGRARYLWPVPPWRVRANRTTEGDLFYHVTGTKGQSLPVWPEEILHFRGLMSHGLLAMSPIVVLRDAIGMAIAAEETASAFWANGASPGGVLSVDHELSPDARDRIKTSWAERHGGAGNRFKVALLEEGMKWQQITTDPSAAQMLESRQWSVGEAARIMGVPPHMIGDLSNATFSNIEHQGREFATMAVRPWCVIHEQTFERGLLQGSELRTHRIEYDLRGLMEGDTATRSTYYRDMLGMGVYSINDVLLREGDNPVEGGDRRFVPLNMVPLDQVDTLLDPGDQPPALPPGDSPDHPAGTRSLPMETREVSAHLRRAALLRLRVRDSYRGPLQAFWERMIRREVRAVRRAVKQHQTDGVMDAPRIRSWLAEWYRSQPEFVARQYAPVIDGLTGAVWAAAVSEVAGELEDESPREKWVEGFVAITADREAGSSQGQLLALLEADEERAGPALEQRLDEWDERRPGKLAMREVVDASEGIAREAWIAAGIGALIWATQGRTCPLCQQMDGRRTPILTPFLASGSVVGSLTVGRKVTHPQLHEGCDCYLVPGV